MTLTTQEMMQVVRDVFEQGWNRQEFDSFAPHLADEIVFNYRRGQQTTNLNELKGLVAWWLTAFPDLEFEVVGLTGSDDLVAVNLVLRGTHEGSWMELQPTGRTFEVDEMMFFRFEDGLVVELWEVFDEHELRHQLGG